MNSKLHYIFVHLYVFVIISWPYSEREIFFLLEIWFFKQGIQGYNQIELVFVNRILRPFSRVIYLTFFVIFISAFFFPSQIMQFKGC